MRLVIACLILIFNFFLAAPISAQENPRPPAEEKLETIVRVIKEEKEIEIAGKKQIYQKLELEITSGENKGKKIIVENGNIPLANIQNYKLKDKLLVTTTKDFQNKDVFYITDYVRRASLYWLFAVFVGLTILIGRIRGMASLLGMGVSFFVIFTFILPQIAAGSDPVFITILASLLIIPITFFLSHGFNIKTLSAVLGTIISLIITGLLANGFVEISKLTGFASEETSFLRVISPDLINMKGLLLAGIIIGVLGILDDITITQASLIQKLRQASPKISFFDLYYRAMDVGKDHIASVVNTLVLVYTGASMPLLLLFINNPQPFLEVINYEIIAEEIVRTLVASIGLILAVPITSLITVYLLKLKSR